MEDCLVITVDVNGEDRPTLLVTRSLDALSFKIVNQIFDDDALETYNKLVGNVKKCCDTCKHCNRKGITFCMHPNHLGDYVPRYTVCNDFEKK